MEIELSEWKLFIAIEFLGWVPVIDTAKLSSTSVCARSPITTSDTIYYHHTLLRLMSSYISLHIQKILACLI